MNELTTINKEVAEPSVAMMLQGIVERGITPENVAAMEQLVGLYERMESKKAEREFNAAFAELQSEMPSVVATKAVPNSDGTVRYKFAPFEEILGQVQPFLTKHGFSVSFNTKPFSDGRITVVCVLRHTSGHSKDNEFSVRVGKGPPGSSETQADGAAKTYAKRGALSDALNIVVDHDDDARLIGSPLGKAEIDNLKFLVEQSGADEEKFLKFAGAAHYEGIAEDRYDSLVSFLEKKISRGKAEKRNEKGEIPW